jgi:hypothetical protein
MAKETLKKKLMKRIGYWRANSPFSPRSTSAERNPLPQARRALRSIVANQKVVTQGATHKVYPSGISAHKHIPPDCAKVQSTNPTVRIRRLPCGRDR